MRLMVSNPGPSGLFRNQSPTREIPGPGLDSTDGRDAGHP
jgi:hypothetical protein